MSNFKFLLTAIFCIYTFIDLKAQYRNGKAEIGLLIGGSNYFGDLSPEITLGETKFSAGVFVRKNHSKFFSSRYQFAYARISGSDQNFSANQYRNLSFFSNIYELGYNIEFNFLPFGMNILEEKSTTYVFAGVNMFLFNPKAKLPGGDKVSLRDYGTEGQVVNNEKKYALIQPSISLGLGYKMNLSDKWVLGAELGFRKTFTDYLDDTKDAYPDYYLVNNNQGGTAADLSQPQTTNDQPVIDSGTMRGDKHLKDWYFIAGMTISYRFVTTFCGKPF